MPSARAPWAACWAGRWNRWCTTRVAMPRNTGAWRPACCWTTKSASSSAAAPRIAARRCCRWWSAPIPCCGTARCTRASSIRPTSSTPARRPIRAACNWPPT
ncbi:hypothetical protein G6F57_023198 [Rhizopus arrhizus]|nr:hypothetical protein G6F57_023198 [Rhizopus arrhizus]